jgi:DNA-binding CsgD family transcriptional regulator
MAYVSKWVLTAREAEITRLVAKGMTNHEVARELGIQQNTVQSILHAVFVKLRVVNRTELAVKVQQAAKAGASL